MSAPATRAPSALASLAADLQALAIQRLDAGDLGRPECAREILFDARHHTVYDTRIDRNAHCRWPHEAPRWRIETSAGTALGDLLAPGVVSMAAPGHAFVTTLRCRRCAAARPIFALRRSLAAESPRCPACATPLPVTGFDLAGALDRAMLPPALLEAPLSRTGLRPGDVVTLHDADGTCRHVELAGLARGAGATVVVLGCGAIGSHLCSHVARMPQLKRVVLVDPERYDRTNLASQSIDAGDVGQPKALVQARHMRRINPGLHVEARIERLEDAPLGLYRAALLAGCLDSRAARLRLSEIAWQLGCPLVDAGIDRAGMLARVTVVLPQPDGACGVCSWSDADYGSLEQTHPCVELARAALAPKATPASAAGV